MKFDNGVFIESLMFSEYGYGWPEENYQYKFKNGEGQIFYTFCPNEQSPLINVKDNIKFSNRIFEIIKGWKRKYFWKCTICDGTLWELRIKLSNGKYLKFEGHEKYPENYSAIRGYLNHFVGKYAKRFNEEYRKYGY